MARIDDVKRSLWPRAPYTPWLTPNARTKAAEVYGPGLDVGALRATASGGVEVRTVNGWVPYIEAGHKGIADVFARLGPGWSWGPNSASTHGAARGWYEDIEGHRPDAMTSTDLQYNKAMFEEYRDRYNLKHAPKPQPTPGPEPVPSPKPTPVPTPVPVSGGLQPLSPAAVRVVELKAIVDRDRAFLDRIPGWFYAAMFSAPVVFQVEAVRVWRRLRQKLGDTRELPKEDR